MKKTLFIVIAILVVVCVFVFLRFFSKGAGNSLIPQENIRNQDERQVENEIPNSRMRVDDGMERNGKVGGDRDEHGCIGSAGYQWCPSTGKCQRMWEEYCEEYKDQFREKQ